MSYSAILTVILALIKCDFGLSQTIEGECALQLNGPGRISLFDFNTNTLRGGPQ